MADIGCTSVPVFSEIKTILDEITKGRSMRRMRQAHESEDFGWRTKEQLINSAVWPRGPGGDKYQLIDLELVEQGRGDETNLVKSLRGTLASVQRMPLRPRRQSRYATDQEMVMIVEWLNAGMPE